MSNYSIERILSKIERLLYEFLHKSFPEPTQLTLEIEGESMGSPISKNVGSTVPFVVTENDTTTTPPTVFPIIPANIVYSQDVTTSGTLVTNADGSADLTGTAAGAVTVTATDSTSNPNQVLTDSVVVTFTAAVVVPNELVLTAS